VSRGKMKTKYKTDNEAAERLVRHKPKLSVYVVVNVVKHCV